MAATDSLTQFISALSECIGMRWKDLARSLGLQTTEIDAIEYDNLLNLKEQIHQFFHKWKQQQGKGASVEMLIEGLKAAGLQEQLNYLEKRGLLKKADTSSKLRSPSDSSAEQELVRRKRLEHLSPGSKMKSTTCTSPASSDRPFERGDMVKVPQKRETWYGVIRWIGTTDIHADRLTAGVEMDNEVPGGGAGEFLGGKQYFTCTSGHGLYLPIERLKRVNPDEYGSLECNVKDSGMSVKSPGIGIPVAGDSDDQVEKDTDKRIAAATARSRSLEATTPVKSTPTKKEVHRSKSSPDALTELLREHGLLDETRSSTATQAVNDHSNDSDEQKILIFHFPGDQAGLIIGRDGQNVRDVETATNTKIEIDKPGRGDLSRNGRAAIVGKEVDCKRALRTILENLNRKIARHVAATETIMIPNSRLCGKVIGKDGLTLRAIESLSGARVKIEQKDGIARILDETATCKIIGSAEEIKKAKDLIERAMQGEDIAMMATLVAVLPVLMKEFKEKHGFQFKFDSNDLD